MKLISIVIPVYQNRETIQLICRDIQSLFTSALASYDFEVIFVDDGSSDGSFDEIKKCMANDSRVRAIQFSRNFGQMAAILAGWKKARGDAVINISADLQDPVAQMSPMIQAWSGGSDIVVSYRINRHDPWFAVICSKLFYRLMRLTFPQMPEGGFDFALIGRKPMDAINQLKERNRFYQGDIFWVGFTSTFLPYTRLKREFGKSQYTFIRRLGNFGIAYLNVSYLPIRCMSFLGFIFFLAGILYSITIVYAYFISETPFVGWAPLMILVLMLGGLTMLMLGIIGEYIWRIYDEVKGRPQYIIKE
jgi:glycosyltransferase involved in cell wall biosynthesis